MGHDPPGQKEKTIGQKKYCIDYSIGARKSNYFMVMMITHMAYNTCSVTNDAWHTYDVIGVYKIQHGAGSASYFTKPAILAILWLANMFMGDVGSHNRGACPLAKGQIPFVRK